MQIKGTSEATPNLTKKTQIQKNSNLLNITIHFLKKTFLQNLKIDENLPLIAIQIVGTVELSP